MLNKKLQFFLFFLSFLITESVDAQVTITQWNFDQQTLNPSTGTGTASPVGGTVTSFAAGNPNLYAWSTDNYPAQSTATATAGAQFNVSTAGYNSIEITWENRNAATAANRLRLQYTINGSDWLNFEASNANATNINDGTAIGFDAGRFITNATDWFYRSADFSAIPGVEQNPLFAVRMVTEYEDATSYGATLSGNSYDPAGNIRFENITFSGIAGTPDPAATTVILPLYISGNTPANNRIPFAYRASFSYLTPNTTYRYINTVVTAGDDPTSAGAGAMIFVNSDGTFTRSAAGSFTTAGDYGQFTTDANGNYTGWFITEPTTNTRFSPGNEVFMRIRLNDGANGTIPVHYFTLSEGVSVLQFSTATGSTEGTGIRAVSMAGAGNFAMLYDNEQGTGRPLFGTSIESTGIDFTTLLYADFFRNNVAGINGAWGGIVPNINANGLRRIEERSRTNGAVVSTNTSADGMWGTVSTVNPTGGLNNILVIDLIPDSELTAVPSALNGFSYMMNTGPSLSQSYQLSGTDLVGTGDITVTAPIDYEISNDNITFSSSLSFPCSGGVITGQPVTVHVRLKAGLTAGNYNNEPVINEGGNAPTVNVLCSGNVLSPDPSLAGEVIPQYIQGINGNNNQRIPYAFRMTIEDLIPGGTYRFYNQAVLGTDPSTADGEGVAIFSNMDGSFTRSESPNLSTSYGEFMAGTDGTYSGWFILESTGDARFTPGNQLFMRLMLNNGIGGDTVSCRLTSTTAASVINFGTDTDPDMGTGIRALSASEPGNFVFLFDNTTGTGRPLYATTIETTGIDFTTGYTLFYSSDVEGVNGSWGGIIPNILPSGVQRIEELSNEDASLITQWTSGNGIWDTTDTRNPVGGDINELVLDLLPDPVPTLVVNPSTLEGFTYLVGFGPSPSQTYLLSGENLEGSGSIIITAPSHYELSLNDTTYVDQLDVDYTNGSIINQPVTIYVRLKTGLEAGPYSNEYIIHTGGGAPETTVSLIGEVTLPDPPMITESILPMFIEGVNGSNNNRVPFAYRAKIENLTPNATYRFYNKAVVDSDAPDYTGVGNPIFVNADGTFTRTTGTSLGTTGQYGEFITDNDGTYSGWFMLEPIGNERFTPGNSVMMRIVLNDGNNGTDIVSYITSEESSKVLMFETQQDTTHGTAIRGTSNDISGDFVFLYDDIETSIRPLYGTSIETTGLEFAATGVYAPFYSNIVAGDNGAWGGIVPNVNPLGIQMIKVYSNTSGEPVSSYEMPGGIWGITDTRNPSGGVDEVLYINLETINVKDNDLTQVNIYSQNQSIVIEPENHERYNVAIFNLQGQLLKSFNGYGYQVITTNLANGLYVIKYSSLSGSSSKKIFLK